MLRGREGLRLISATALLLAAAWPLGAGTPYRFLEEPSDPEFNVGAKLQRPAKWPAGELRICFCYTDDAHHYFLGLADGQAIFFKVTEQGPERLGATGRLPDGVQEFDIVRRDWRMALTCNGRVVTQAYDATYQGGRAGWWSSTEQLQLEEAFVQPIEHPQYLDDFVRGSEQLGQWEVVTGNWDNTAVMDVVEEFRPERNANPFAFSADRPKQAIATIGWPFWDEYAEEVGAKLTSPGTIGLLAYYQDPQNHVLFQWSNEAPPPTARQLVEVVDGRRTVLASAAGPPVPGHWYRLGLAARSGALEASIDGQTVLRGGPSQFGQGRVGLYASGAETALFDDFRVYPSTGVTEDFAQGMERWQVLQGHWVTRDGQLKTYAPAGATRILFGSPSWTDYVLHADLAAQASAGVGIIFCYQSPEDYYLFRWGSTADGAYRFRRQVVRVVGGHEEVIAQTLGSYRPGHKYHMALTYEDGWIEVQADGEQLIECADATFTHGRAGFFAEGTKGAWFSDFRLASTGRRHDIPCVTEQFTQEATMAGWASPAGSWEPDGSAMWYKATFFAPAWVRVDLPEVGRHGGRVRLVLAPDASDAQGGYYVVAEMSPGSREITAALWRRAEKMSAGTYTAPEDTPFPTLLLEQRGRCVLATVNGECVAAVLDERPLQCRRAGIELEGLPVRLERAYASSDNVLDYTFSGPPTDWYAGSGDWSIIDRWPCERGWAWFGAAKSQMPVVWSRRAFQGDLVFEYYGAILMDLPRSPGYSHATDLNCTICGDGTRVDSGYSFIHAGWGNTASGLINRKQLVEKNDRFRFRDPRSDNLSFHRHWFYVRIEKEGNRIRQYIDDTLIAEFEDPDPLPGGRIGLWTWDNGALVARARVSFQHAGQPLDPSSLPPLGHEPDKTDLPFKLYGK